jgi:hypothetical protein
MAGLVSRKGCGGGIPHTHIIKENQPIVKRGENIMTIEEMIKRLQAMLHEGTPDGTTKRHLYVDVCINGEMKSLLVSGVENNASGYDLITVYQ